MNTRSIYASLTEELCSLREKQMVYFLEINKVNLRISNKFMTPWYRQMLLQNRNNLHKFNEIILSRIDHVEEQLNIAFKFNLKIEKAKNE